MGGEGAGRGCGRENRKRMRTRYVWAEAFQWQNKKI